MLVLGRVHVVAQRVSSGSQLSLETQVGGSIALSPANWHRSPQRLIKANRPPAFHANGPESLIPSPRAPSRRPPAPVLVPRGRFTF
jgi:hypothetical protein